MPLILPPKSGKMHLREYTFSKFPEGACAQTPLGIACQSMLEWVFGPHTHLPTYPPRLPPVNNFY